MIIFKPFFDTEQIIVANGGLVDKGGKELLPFWSFGLQSNINYAINWVLIYPVDNIINPLNISKYQYRSWVLFYQNLLIK